MFFGCSGINHKGVSPDADSTTLGPHSFEMTRLAARRALAEAGLLGGIGDVQVIELHDCFSANELITYEALGKTRPV